MAEMLRAGMALDAQILSERREDEDKIEGETKNNESDEGLVEDEGYWNSY